MAQSSIPTHTKAIVYMSPAFDAPLEIDGVLFDIVGLTVEPSKRNRILCVCELEVQSRDCEIYIPFRFYLKAGAFSRTMDEAHLLPLLRYCRRWAAWYVRQHPQPVPWGRGGQWVCKVVRLKEIYTTP